MPELAEDAALTAEEILTFGPCVESVVWTPAWLRESRAPIARAAGRPKLKRVFDEDGVGKAVVIRPCMSRGKRIRGLPPVYTPQMLESNARVFSGWPSYWDHVPAKLVKTLAAAGRSAKELSGQVLESWWQKGFTHDDDAAFGYRPGGVVASYWATPLVRETVDNNPNLLHTSINAWPTSGKPGPCPWLPSAKGMLIEGIRKQPQGSLDLVPRGGAGGRLLAEGEWPEPVWEDEDVELVVSLAESFYASAVPQIDLSKMKPDELREHVRQHAPHLLPSLAEAATSSGSGSGGDDDEDDAPPPAKRRRKASSGSDTPAVTEADVTSLIEGRLADERARREDAESRLEERAREIVQEREGQRALERVAHQLIESAEGIPLTWKADLKARYTMLPSGPPQALVLQESDLSGDDGKLTESQAIESRVKADLEHVRDLLAEARGKPRVRGEGGAQQDPAERQPAQSRRSTARGGNRAWRTRFAEMGLVESEDKALDSLYGEAVEA